MKKYFIALAFMLALITTPLNAGWFDRDEKRIHELQEAVEDQRDATRAFRSLALFLAVTNLISFTIGTILGSRTRRNDNESDTDTDQ